MSKAFITGATGFVGSHLTDKLLEKGWEVYCLKRKTSNTKWLDGKNVKFVEGDLFSNESLENVIKDVDYVFHLAGVVKAKTKDGFEKGNYLATKNLIEITSKVNQGLKKFIHVSSQAVCGPTPDSNPINETYTPKPITTYGRTKLKAENEVLSYKNKLNVAVVRPPAVYGPRDTEVFVYFQAFVKGLNSIIGLNDKYLSIVYVEDLVNGIILAAEKEIPSGEIFFICSDNHYNWNEIGDITSKLLGKKAIKLRLPHWLVYTAGAFAQTFSMFSKNAATLNLEKCKDITQKYWTCSNQKAQTMLGFKEEFPLEKGFAESIKWYKQNNWI